MFAISAFSWVPLLAVDFPRGPGFYFSPYRLFVLLAIFVAWISACDWVSRDTKQLRIEPANWNLLVAGAGIFGFILVWIVPSFWLGLVILLAILGGAFGWYISVHNERVHEKERIFSATHMRGLLRHYLKFNWSGSEDDDESPFELPVRFIARSANQREEDHDRVARARQSRGYQAALELVHDAVVARATDIHLEPTKSEMVVRFRVDGMLINRPNFDRAMGDGVINILKVLSNMDITERRKPQDGSFSAEVGDDEVDFRVATAGSVTGEKLVMRLLDRTKQIVKIQQLGMRQKLLEQLVAAVEQPHGLLLVCGPTGAGKSTTLYACLTEIDRFQQNIITLENPVEYQLEGVTQIEVNMKAGKTFASELRSILRQDPDVIMIGEIRDQETAEIACQAAQTGHKVFSTLHANDTVTAISRLVDLGVQPFLISTALNAVLGQRLLRLLCPDCKVRYKPNAESLRKANLPADKIKFLYRPPSEEDRRAETCEKCGGTGYFGRAGVFELLIVTDAIRELLREDFNPTAVRQEAVKSGMRFLYEDGLRQVLEGRTSIQELLRVSK